jgi:hypothetical protein
MNSEMGRMRKEVVIIQEVQLKTESRRTTSFTALYFRL